MCSHIEDLWYSKTVSVGDNIYIYIYIYCDDIPAIHSKTVFTVGSIRRPHRYFSNVTWFEAAALNPLPFTCEDRLMIQEVSDWANRTRDQITLFGPKIWSDEQVSQMKCLNEGGCVFIWLSEPLDSFQKMMKSYEKTTTQNRPLKSTRYIRDNWKTSNNTTMGYTGVGQTVLCGPREFLKKILNQHLHLNRD